MDYRERILYLAENTNLRNAEIARKLGCSKRTVRRHAGPWADRMQLKMGHDPNVIKKEDSARILLLDIESAPMEAFVWQLFKNNYINPDMVVKDWSMLTWSAKWLFEPDVISAKVSGEDAINREDSSILNDLWLLLDEANIVIAHNGKRFDVRKINARFALNGLTPPLPYRVIDTLQVSRQNFAFSSYKLDYINKLFGLTQKGHPGMGVWRQCVTPPHYRLSNAEINEELTKNEEALEEMRAYCDNDVVILEELYLQIRPWVKGHPNVGLYIDTDGSSCTSCGNTDIKWGGSYYTPAGRYKAFRCQKCGAIGRSRTSDLTPEERETLCLSVAA